MIDRATFLSRLNFLPTFRLFKMPHEASRGGTGSKFGEATIVVCGVASLVATVVSLLCVSGVLLGALEPFHDTVQVQIAKLIFWPFQIDMASDVRPYFR